MVAAAIVGGAVIGGVASNMASSNAADTAAEAQIQAANTGSQAQLQAAQLSEAGINSRFQQLQTLFQPFIQTGNEALFAQRNLIGLGGSSAQSQAIEQLQKSPQFQALLKQGETSILQNASATGGLRGGNTQQALSQFSPLLLADMIDRQYNKLGGLTSLGQNSAAGVGNAGVNVGNAVAGINMGAANSITALQQQVGAANAGAALAGGRAQAGIYNSLGSAVGLYAGLGGFNNFGGSTAATNNSGSLGLVNGMNLSDGAGGFA